MNLKQSVIAGLIFVLSIASTIAITKHYFVDTKIVEKTEKIDKSAWIQRSTYLKEKDAKQRLKEQNERLSQIVESRDEQIEELIEIEAKLKTKLDSAQTRVDTVETTSRDTTLTFNKTFGNDLFGVSSVVTVRPNYISNELGLQQLRPVRIDGVLTSVQDPKLFLESPDFDSLSVRSFTVEKKPRYSRTELFIGGTAIGVAGTLLTIILLN